MSTPNLMIADQLEQLARFYRQNSVSEFMTLTLKKLFEYETENSRKQLRELESDMLAFEREYGITSQEFHKRFESGQIDDNMDFTEWASIFQMAERLKKQLALLNSMCEGMDEPGGISAFH